MDARQPTGQDLWTAYPVVARIRETWAEVVRSGRGRVVFVAKPTVTAGRGLLATVATHLPGTGTRQPAPTAGVAGPVVVAGWFAADGGYHPARLPAAVGGSALAIPEQINLAGMVLELGGTAVGLGAPAAGAVVQLVGQLAQLSPTVHDLLARHAGTGQPLTDGSGPGAVRALLRAAARDGPAVCLLDNLDRADQAARWWQELVDRLAGELADRPILLVVTLRGPATPPTLPAASDSSATEPWAAGPVGSPVGLQTAGRLLAAGVADWLPLRPCAPQEVAAWLGPCAPGVADRLIGATGGDPGWLARVWDTWTAPPDPIVARDAEGRWSLDTPAYTRLGDIRDRVYEQLASAYGTHEGDPAVRAALRLLAHAALEGQAFTVTAAALAVGRDVDAVLDDLDDHLSVATPDPSRSTDTLSAPTGPGGDMAAADADPGSGRGLVEQVGFVDLPGPARPALDGENNQRGVWAYRFVSDLVWLVLEHQELLPGRERTEACRAMLAALAEAWTPEPERVAASLAELARQAGEPAAAAHWQAVVDTGRTLDAALAHARWLLTTTSLAGSHPAVQAATVGRFTLLRWGRLPTAERLALTGRWAELAAAGGALGEQARAHLHRGVAFQDGYEDDQAVGEFRQARRLARRGGDWRTVGAALRERAAADLRAGRRRAARRRLVAAWALAHRHHDLLGEADVFRRFAWLDDVQGNPRAAVVWLQAGIDRAEQARSSELLLHLLDELAGVHLRLGEDGQARVAVDRAVDLARRTGHLQAEARALARLGHALEEADPVQAERHLRHAHTLAQQLGQPEVEARVLGCLAWIAQARGDLSTAHDELVTLLRHAQATDDRDAEGAVWAELAELAAASGRPGSAVGMFTLAARLLEPIDPARAAKLRARLDRVLSDHPELDAATLTTQAAEAYAADRGQDLAVQAPVSLTIDLPPGE